MSSKNRLQEYCQQRGWELPVYETVRLPGPDHIAEFQSLVCVNGQETRGASQGTKVGAEQSAAAQALSLLDVAQPKVWQTERQPIRVIMLIDLENVPLPANHVFASNCWPIGFLAKCHHNAQGKARDQLAARLDLRIIDSAVKDAADHLLSFEAGRLCAQLADQNPIFYVVSCDHAAEAVVVAIRQAGFEAHHCTSFL